ncbi:MAG: tRNA (guanosine(37)-N1)-methyltransferase TrmD [Thermoflavifilum sp.]|nr:tRNA (guanosine(37)-N1)-methyltransferase TrmD [Thermoflavifilum sp.]
MRIDIISAVPQLLESPFAHSILKRARERGLLEIQVHNLRDYTPYAHKQIDDYPYGGGAGMVLMPEPLARAIEHLQSQRTYDEIIYLTPDGQTFDQAMANRLSLKNALLLICGHYKGIDERIREKYVTQEISIGDYVISGGELAAAVVTDAVARLIPGVLNDETSALSDSFQDHLLSPPVYTRPADFRGLKVPEILLSGDHEKIAQWRYEKALERTRLRRPDLLNRHHLPEK